MLENETMTPNETPETEGTETVKTTETTETVETPREELSLTDLLKKIEAVQDDAYLKEALAQLLQLGPADATKICAIQELVSQREKTNRQVLDFYMTLYNDQRRKPMSDRDWAEWIESTSRSAGESAKKAGRAAKETAKDWGGRMKDWFKEFEKDLESDKENWGISFEYDSSKPKKEAEKRSLKEKVLAALRDPSLDEETRELILEFMSELKEMTPELQDKALDILTDPRLESADKSRILENLEEIEDLDD